MGTVAAAVRDHVHRVRQPPTSCHRSSSSRCLLAVVLPSSNSFHNLEIWCPSSRAVLKETHLTAVDVRSLHRSRRRRRRAPRLAFCLGRAGPASEGVSSNHHEEVRVHLAYPASCPDSTGPGPRGRCQKAPLSTLCQLHRTLVILG